ncbi:SdrD B-like domain-containing protein [Microbacterium sp. PMB16]|uniref:SdrD B-like domain-containing protein n=1 Tax=Microbacterium sp. PMB16 TaxID=3120157 RepID=UPI003F4B863A
MLLSGTYTTVTFDLTSEVTPYSAFPAATFGTGTAYFANDGTTSADGINGRNVVFTEALLVPGNPGDSHNSDLQRISFRLPEKGSLGDRVWNDVDADGVQDAGESGVGGVTATLTDATGTPVRDATGNPLTTVTAADGSYLFTGLPFGDYRVRFTGLPDRFSFTRPNVGADDADSDADPATGLSSVVRIDTAAPVNLTADAGIGEFGSIGDTVWLDADRDGVQDAAERGVSGVTAVLYGSGGAEIARTTTDSAGKYLFSVLPLGAYSVGFEGFPAGMTLTSRDAGGDDAQDSDADPATGRTATVTLTSQSRDVTSVDAGLVAVLGSIGDTVWRDVDRDGVQDAGESGVPGVTVVLRDGDGDEVEQTTTGADGEYSFDELPLGDKVVEFTDLPDGQTLSPRGAGDDAAVDSDADPATGRTGTVTLTPAVPDRTDVDAGLVTPVPPVLGSIGDRVWSDADRDGVQDAGESGVPDVTVVLRDGDGDEVDRTTTDADGAYSFDELPLGDKVVEFTDLPDGQALSPRGAGDDRAVDSDADPATGRTGTVTLTPAAPDRTDVDAGLVSPVPPVLGSIGDTVWSDADRDGVQDAGESGVPGVTVVLRDGNGDEVERTTTGADGEYSFDELPLGDKVVEFTDLPDGQALSPRGAGDDRAVDSDADPVTGRTGTVALTPTIPDRTDVDAGLVAPVPPVLGSIGSRVWDDRDRDGRQDAEEPGVPGVTVVLYEGGGVGGGPGDEIERTSTDPSGAYLFSDLPLGAYDIAFLELPDGFEFTLRGVGGSDTDSNVDPATGRVRVTLTPGDPDQLNIGAGVRVSAESPEDPEGPGSPGGSDSGSPEGPNATGSLPSTGADAGWIVFLALLGGLLLGGGVLLARRRSA